MNIGVLKGILNAQKQKNPELIQVIEEILNAIIPLTETTEEATEVELIIPSGSSLKAVRSDINQSVVEVLKLDASHHVILSVNHDETGKGHIIIPSSLTPPPVNNNGVLMIDTTNNRLCYYSNGNRRYLAGTVF